ncbi:MULTISPECIES: hypothetical protein [Actinomyces]|uniref:Uncharacterized protein n=1 Tax=Actinomyces respiraculi TaxID=2744574 RepID=A0A7T0PWS7_9ACTO|nr:MULTISPECIES: hypothetical protein [Actinomyces]QPL06039.1 hypothetical protein ID810_03590 [Actinomyces respiraculi]
MTTERRTKSQLALTQESTFPQVLIDGDRESFLEMLDWLSNPVDKLRCNPTTQGDFPPIYALAWRSASFDKLIVEVRDETLCLKGPEKTRSWLVDTVQFLLDDGREYVGMHVEHYPGHPYLSEDSVPLVLTLDPQAHLQHQNGCDMIDNAKHDYAEFYPADFPWDGAFVVRDIQRKL